MENQGKQFPFPTILSLLPEKSLTGFQLMGKANLPSAVSGPFCIQLGSHLLFVLLILITQGRLPIFLPSGNSSQKDDLFLNYERHTKRTFFW